MKKHEQLIEYAEAILAHLDPIMKAIAANTLSEDWPSPTDPRQNPEWLYTVKFLQKDLERYWELRSAYQAQKVLYLTSLSEIADQSIGVTPAAVPDTPEVVAHLLGGPEDEDGSPESGQQEPTQTESDPEPQPAQSESKPSQRQSKKRAKKK